MKLVLVSNSFVAVLTKIMENTPPPCNFGGCVTKPWCEGFTVCEKCTRIERVEEPEPIIGI